MSFQFIVCQLTCVFFFFSFTSLNMCQLLKDTRQPTCIYFLCNFLRVKREKLAKTLSNIYIARDRPGLETQQLFTSDNGGSFVKVAGMTK